MITEKKRLLIIYSLIKVIKYNTRFKDESRNNIIQQLQLILIKKLKMTVKHSI